MEATRTTAAAAQYRRLGWNPIPIKERSKEPNLVQLAPFLSRRATREELKSWEWPGVGVVTGPVSEILVLDVDGPEGLAILEERGHPPTPMARTGGGGLPLLDEGDVRCLRTFLSLGHLVGDLGAFLQRLESAACYPAVVYEDVVAPVVR